MSVTDSSAPASNDQSYLTQKTRPRRRSIIREFALNTSAHGLPEIARSESICNRLFWLISFVAFTGVMTYFIVRSIMAYFDYPTNTDITFQSEWPLAFPAFSLCNISPFRFDLFIEDFVNYTNANGWTDTNDTSTITPQQAGFLWNFLVNQINQNASLTAYSFSISSMLVSCNYNSQPCSASDFTSFMTPDYGSCYTFNAKRNDIPGGGVRDVNLNGGFGTLELGLYVYSNEYIPYAASSVGLIVLLHDNTEFPRIDEAGLELIPGQNHRLSFRKKVNEFLPAPFGDCTEQISSAMAAVFSTHQNIDYEFSEDLCYQICLQSYTYNKCGCVIPFLWNMRTILRPGTNDIFYAPLCDVSNQCTSNATIDLFADSSVLQENCPDCAPECTLTTFTVQKSGSRAPLEWQMDDIKYFVENISTVPLPLNWSTQWREEIRLNYLSVNIVKESDIVETDTQNQALGFVDVISNIGGQSGLWIGMSFLSIMEVIVMLYRVIRVQCRLMLQS